jgi:hypothetical protein
MKITIDNEQMQFKPENGKDIFNLGVLSKKVKEGYELSFNKSEIAYIKFFTSDIVNILTN